MVQIGYTLKGTVENPRHIEVQILADNSNIIHLGERECSIQRRHQKLIEETPSPALTKEMRNKITETAIAIMREIGYENAGTVEFLFKEGKYYFMEVNARIQVEHPITEEVTGIDIIEQRAPHSFRRGVIYKTRKNKTKRTCNRMPNKCRESNKLLFLLQGSSRNSLLLKEMELE